MSNTYSRPDKLTDAQTILYEIDMLRFSRNRLSEGNFQSDADEWIYLEAFLLHFRNLIEFFRGKISGDTLTTLQSGDFWSKDIPDITELVRPDLWAKYEERKKATRTTRFHATCNTARNNG